MASPATEHVGTSTLFRPAAFASAPIADGVMSGVPAICSLARLSRTVPWPEAPTTMAPMPSAIRTTLTATPAYWKSFLDMPPFQPRRGRAPSAVCRSTLRISRGPQRALQHHARLVLGRDRDVAHARALGLGVSRAQVCARRDLAQHDAHLLLGERGAKAAAHAAAERDPCVGPRG